jgi:hypothetical protein
MRDFSSSFFISTTEKEVKTSQKQQRFFRERERQRQRDRETNREEKILSLVVVSRIIIIIRERERERERDSYLVTHDVYLCVVGQKVCGVFDNFEDKKGEEKKESFGESAAQSFGG